MTMLRSSLVVIGLSVPAQAEPPHMYDGGDVLEIRQCDPWPCVYYHNVVGKESRQGNKILYWSGNRIDVYIKVGEAETITITPEDDQIVPEVRQADVLDGEDIYINLIIPVS